METQDNKNTTSTPEKMGQGFNNNSGSGRAIGGIIIIIIGSLLLAKQAGAEFPHWFFSWKTLVIAIGIFVGAKSNFREWGWLIPVTIGVVFLLEDFVPDLHIRHFVWPIVLICIGLAMILRSRGKSMGGLFKTHGRNAMQTNDSTDGVFESVTIFGENKKQILSKDFKGGENVCVFGGAEINLTQADINGTAYLELVQVFGGTKLIVPSHWKVETKEMVSVFGGLNDKRQFHNSVTDESKVLVLTGVSIFGGIDIKSF